MNRMLNTNVLVAIHDPGEVVEFIENSPRSWKRPLIYRLYFVCELKELKGVQTTHEI